MGCSKLTYRNFSFLEVVHRKNVTAFKKNRRNGDHLGNIRLSYTDADGNESIDPANEIVKESNYYPFGLQHKGYNNVVSSNANSAASKYKFNGVELEESLGLDLYEMDVRSYDPAIGRFTSIDPVTHFDYSTYSAFDNNPVFWADPSGADAACNTCGEATDMWGRARYDKWGMYIPPNERVSADQDSYIDKIAVKALKETAKLYIDGVDLSNLSEKEKQKIFKEDELGTIGVLLWEFATGTGKEVRKFDVGVHPFANRLMEGRILEEIVNEFNTALKAQGYAFNSVGNTDNVSIALEFSPTKNPSSWLESLQKHANSNASQFFVGGAVAKVRIQDRNLMIQIYNETSRSSLMLHIAKNYDRKNGNKPLSTIKQYINASYKLISDDKK